MRSPSRQPAIAQAHARLRYVDTEASFLRAREENAWLQRWRLIQLQWSVADVVVSGEEDVGVGLEKIRELLECWQ